MANRLFQLLFLWISKRVLFKNKTKLREHFPVYSISWIDWPHCTDGLKSIVDYWPLLHSDLDLFTLLVQHQSCVTYDWFIISTLKTSPSNTWLSTWCIKFLGNVPWWISLLWELIPKSFILGQDPALINMFLNWHQRRTISVFTVTFWRCFCV